eukprot:385414_1
MNGIKWQWMNDQNQWQNYDDSITKEIEKSYKAKDTKCTVDISSNKYEIRLNDLFQYSVKTTGTRRIQRKISVNHYWQWQDENKTWNTFDKNVSETIEIFYLNNNTGSTCVNISSKSYQIDPFTKSQTNIQTKYRRYIRRLSTNTSVQTAEVKQESKEFEAKQSESIHENNELKFIIPGQGTVQITQIINNNKHSPFKIILYNKNIMSKNMNITLSVHQWESSMVFSDKLNKSEIVLVKSKESEKILINNQGNGIYTYWLSIDTNHNAIKFGIGEVRDILTKLKCTHDTTKGCQRIANFMKAINCARIEIMQKMNNQITFQTHKTYVLSQPIMVKDSNTITMDDIDGGSSFVVAGNLPQNCLNLYNSIHGKHFTINDEIFPNFADAIQKSINNKNGWCHKKLIEKAGQSKMSYLRITLGSNVGDSPGIPYVLEIWPSGHYSPIHNHANAYAIIRVLHGEVLCNLYAYLSEHNKEPFVKKLLKKNDITYIYPGVNQVHKLENISETVAITIQCYQYDDSDNEHYEYSDYVKDKKMQKFKPKSDMSFNEFKKEMQKEWNGHYFVAKEIFRTLHQ